MAIDALAAQWLRRGSNDIETKAIPAIPHLCVNSREGREVDAVEAQSIPSRGGPPSTQECEIRGGRGTVIAAADAVVTTLSFGWPRQPLTSSQIAAGASD